MTLPGKASDIFRRYIAFDLGTPEEMRVMAEQGIAPKCRPKVNTHAHLPPNVSVCAVGGTLRAVPS